MNDTTQENIKTWARDFYGERKESIDYFLKFGSPVEKALVKKVMDLAGVEA